MRSVKNIVLNTFNLKGTTSRKEYWIYIITYYISFMIISLILGAISGRYIRLNNIEPLGSMFTEVYTYFPILLIPMISATVRRLRDAGLSVWFVFIPIVNVLLCLKPSVYQK